MKRVLKLEAALERLLKALDGYQRHGDLLTDRYKNALLDAKIEAIEALNKDIEEMKK
jgi:hypothetical protein